MIIYSLLLSRFSAEKRRSILNCKFCHWFWAFDIVSLEALGHQFNEALVIAEARSDARPALGAKIIG